ncbi:MAG: transglycosylase SLT domain-containing protein [Pyrinomonadaceae bacterium]|nr:transglycosylase SLT domain-containing protein [Pyrinomonadaceae bacterium]
MMTSNCKRLIFLVLLLSIHISVYGQSARERQERIRVSMDGGDDVAALNELRQLAASDPAQFALNNYDYLLARLSERRGDRAGAAAAYQKLVARNSLLTEYSLWHLSQIARTMGNLVLEREQLRQLLLTAPASLLREAAEARLAESFFESGDYNSAIQLLRPRAGEADKRPTAREALSLIGQAYLKSNQQEAAREVFNTLLSKMPDATRPDDYALAAVRGLDVLDSGSAEKAASPQAPQLAESEHLRRAFIYNFNRDFSAARRHYMAIVERYAQSANLSDALYQTGRTFYQESRFDESIGYFQRVSQQFPDSAGARDALAQMAAAYARTKRYDEALNTYKRIIERYTEQSVQERAYLNIIDVLRDAGRDREALEWARDTRTRFRGQAGALALFSQARIHLTQGAWAEALADFDALMGEGDLGVGRAAGGTNKTEIAFARAYVLEQMGRADDAVGAYLSIPDGRNEYYGWRATERLRGMARAESTRASLAARLQSLRAEAQQAISNGDAERARTAAHAALRLTEDESVRREMLDIASRAYARLPAYNRLPQFKLLPFGRQEIRQTGSTVPSKPTHKALADELLFLGLYDEGAPELAVAENVAETSVAANNSAETAPKPAAPSSSSSRDALYTLAVLYKRGEEADHAIRFVEPIWKTMPADFLLELAPREMVELFYPAPYRSALLEYAPQRGVDPRFVLSIMRQESRFRADAKSISAARGLMQFIPSTADQMAAQLGRKGFIQDELYAPRTAILFGSQYLGNLFKMFPGMPQAVAASYNGGEDNVARWKARARTDDPDRYVLEIAYAQSKDYVYKVLANFRVYQTLYNEQLKPR